MTLVSDIASDLDSVFYDTDSGFAVTVTRVLLATTFPGIEILNYAENFASTGTVGQDSVERIIRTPVPTVAFTIDETLSIDSVQYKIREIRPPVYGEQELRLGRF